MSAAARSERLDFELAHELVPVVSRAEQTPSASEPAEAVKAQANKGVWADDEVRLLHALTLKYPSGVPQRWVTIAAELGRPVADVTAKAAQLKNSAAAAHAHGGAADAWSAEQHRALVRALGIVPATLEPAARWTRVAELVPGKSAAECAGMWRQLRALEKRAAEPAAVGAEARVAAAAAAAPADEAAEAWTPRQQQQLEEALRRFPPKEASAWESAVRHRAMAHACAFSMQGEGAGLPDRAGRGVSARWGRM